MQHFLYFHFIPLHEPDGRRPGRILTKKKQEICISPNGCHLRRAPEPNRGEGACGWSGAPQRRGTPSLTNTKLLGYPVIRYLRRSVSGRVRRWFFLAFSNNDRAKDGEGVFIDLLFLFPFLSICFLYTQVFLYHLKIHIS